MSKTTIGLKPPNKNIPADPVVPVPPLLLPGAPTGLSATWTAEGEITLSWSPHADATSYHIYFFELENDGKTDHPQNAYDDYIENGGVYPVESELLDTGGELTATTYVHSGLLAFYGYSYIITSVNDNGESVGSPSSFAYALPIPIALTITAFDLVLPNYRIKGSDTGLPGFTNGTVWDDTMTLYWATSGTPGPGNYDEEHDLAFTIEDGTFSFVIADPIGPPIIPSGSPGHNSSNIGGSWAVYGTNISGDGPISNVIVK